MSNFCKANKTTKEAERVVGAEVHLWAEQTDPTNLDRRIWPRASAAGEVMWSGRRYANGSERSHIDATPRLIEFRQQLVQRGIAAEPLQPLWCMQRRGACLL